jgi:hypothetical protein
MQSTVYFSFVDGKTDCFVAWNIVQVVEILTGPRNPSEEHVMI